MNETKLYSIKMLEKDFLNRPNIMILDGNYKKSLNESMNDLDYFPADVADPPGTTVEYSISNEKVLVFLINLLKEENLLNSILEIGLGHTIKESTTNTVFDNKLSTTKYLGIDSNIQNIHQVRARGGNIYVGDSENFEEVINILKILEIESLDLFVIDGWHSVNQVYEEWRYSSLLSDNGFIWLHDTNYHPGPIVILNSLNPEIWEWRKFSLNEKDCGCAVVWRKGNKLAEKLATEEEFSDGSEYPEKWRGGR